MRFADPFWLQALWAVPTVFGLLALGLHAQRRRLRRFAEPGMLRGLTGGVPWARRWLKAGLVCGALAAMILAMARPQWGERERETVELGRDLIFVIDVSRSMLVEDVAPNRLARARLWIRDLVDSRPEDRVAIVAFAGTARLRSPLTFDRNFFYMVLDELGPESVPMGGTMIGDAIRLTLDRIVEPELERDGGSGRPVEIVLVADWEDQGSFPEAAAARAAELGVRLIGIGVGSESGGPVPAPEGAAGAHVRFEGEPVVSRLDVETMRRVIGATPGAVLLNVGTGSIELDRVYASLPSPGEDGLLPGGRIDAEEDRYYVFVAIALLLLLLDGLIPEGRRRR